MHRDSRKITLSGAAWHSPAALSFWAPLGQIWELAQNLVVYKSIIIKETQVVPSYQISFISFIPSIPICGLQTPVATSSRSHPDLTLSSWSASWAAAKQVSRTRCRRNMVVLVASKMPMEEVPMAEKLLEKSREKSRNHHGNLEITMESPKIFVDFDHGKLRKNYGNYGSMMEKSPWKSMFLMMVWRLSYKVPSRKCRFHSMNQKKVGPVITTARKSKIRSVASSLTIKKWCLTLPKCIRTQIMDGFIWWTPIACALHHGHHGQCQKPIWKCLVSRDSQMSKG